MGGKSRPPTSPPGTPADAASAGGAVVAAFFALFLGAGLGGAPVAALSGGEPEAVAEDSPLAGAGDAESASWPKTHWHPPRRRSSINRAKK